MEPSSNTVAVTGPKGTLERTFGSLPLLIEYSPGEKEITVTATFPRKHEKALVGTIAGHIQNMMKGVTEGFTCKMQIVTSHFPASVEVRGDEILIKNLYGQKNPLRTQKFGKVDVAVKGDIITITGMDIHEVSNTGGRMQQLCMLRGKRAKDPTTFQDGVYVIEKAH